ncbi:TetR/AcrR family transcriptional regulator [Limibacillus halophilus]|jgi:AcrR family transcriptional regulator
MTRAVQQRAIETHARLLAAAEDVIAEKGFEALRVEEVVLRAGTAKGTFFAHFKDKDALMERIVAARIEAYMDEMEDGPAPQDVAGLVEAVLPLCRFMTCERYVFDLILRHSGAAAVEEIGPIAQTFGRQVEIFDGWLATAPFRQDVAGELLAEGIHAFMIHAMATQFCALHNSRPLRDQLSGFLMAWLNPA